MAGTADLPPNLTRESEEAGFFHEAALNATWNGVRLAVGGLSFAFGCFVIQTTGSASVGSLLEPFFRVVFVFGFVPLMSATAAAAAAFASSGTYL